MIKNLIVSLLFITNVAWGNCPKPVTFVELGTNVSCDGYLFTLDAEIKNRTKLVELELKDKKLILLDQENDVLNKRIKNLQELNSTYEEKLSRKDKWDSWENLGYFSLGVLLTGILAVNLNDRLN